MLDDTKVAAPVEKTSKPRTPKAQACLSRSRLTDIITFQKALTLAVSAPNQFEAAAAERAVHRLMASRNIDPTRVPDQYFLSRHINFANSALLRKLRDEYRALHPLPKKKKRNPRKVEEPTSFGKIPFDVRGYSRLTAENKEYERKHRNERRRAKRAQQRTALATAIVNPNNKGAKRDEKNGTGRLQRQLRESPRPRAGPQA